ncbi:hypothetical protein [Cochlodiniinecator piscidefendens]|uniref:hypothetical protein n=1 Tax=Cochlodiniinecator piscidefendens TaxID=2715756 RepID=UPI00140D7D4F|nr:hypothetical protein [Cochlodiniinecator piscidefendens]
MKRVIGVFLASALSSCGLSEESQAVGPMVAHNPTLAYLEYIETPALKELQSLGALRASSVLALSGSISDRCDYVDINTNSQAYVRQNLSRAVLFRGRAAMVQDVAATRTSYGEQFNVSFEPDATSNLCHVAERVFADQSAISAYLVDRRLGTQ